MKNEYSKIPTQILAATADRARRLSFQIPPELIRELAKREDYITT